MSKKPLNTIDSEITHIFSEMSKKPLNTINSEIIDNFSEKTELTNSDIVEYFKEIYYIEKAEYSARMKQEEEEAEKTWMIVKNLFEELGIDDCWSNGYIYEFVFNDYCVKITDQKSRQFINISKNIGKELRQEFGENTYRIYEIIENIIADKKTKLKDYPSNLIAEIKKRYINEITQEYEVEYDIENAILFAVNIIKKYLEKPQKSEIQDTETVKEEVNYRSLDQHFKTVKQLVPSQNKIKTFFSNLFKK